MKHLLSSLVMVVLLSASLSAQVPQTTTLNPTNGAQHTQFATQFGAATINFTIAIGETNHQYTYSAPGYNVITVTVKAGTGGSLSTVGTSTTTGADTITWTGTYTQGQIIFSGLTGGGALNGDYFGTTNANGSVTGDITANCAVTTANPTYSDSTTEPCSMFTNGGTRIYDVTPATGPQTKANSNSSTSATDAMWPLTPSYTYMAPFEDMNAPTALTNTTTTVLTASTVLIGSINCSNITAGAVTVTFTNTAGTNLVPPAFSIPALSEVTFGGSIAGWKLAVGIKGGASANTSVYCTITGWK